MSSKRRQAAAEPSDSEPEEVPVRRNKRTRGSTMFYDSEDEHKKPSQMESDADFSSDGETSESEDERDNAYQTNNNNADIADIPLGQLIAIKEDGTTTAEGMKARARSAKKKEGSFKRDHKHRPSEMSSKKPVPVLRDTLQMGTRRGRDPRFENLTAGKFVESSFKRRYAFLYDEKLPEERREVQEALKRTKSEAKKIELQARLSRVTQDIKTEQARRRRAGVQEDAKSKERAAVADGKKPFYLKKSEKKRQELVSKYEELKSTGQLEKYMEKRRKRNAAKDHRYLPARRPGGDEGAA